MKQLAALTEEALTEEALTEEMEAGISSNPKALGTREDHCRAFEKTTT